MKRENTHRVLSLFLVEVTRLRTSVLRERWRLSEVV